MVARSLTALVLLGLLTLGGSSARAASASLDANLDSIGTSNLFLDVSNEWDLIVHPTLELALDFSDIWSAGYGGELNIFTQHEDLLSHWHEAFLFVNPAWGADGENEWALEARAQWLSNRETYETLDFLQAGLLSKLALEPVRWLRWRATIEGSFRHFYNDSASSSFDVSAQTSLTFVLPSRTSLTPRVGYGLRRYATPIALADGSSDSADHRLEIGMHIGQGLWSGAGLQVEGAWMPELGPNALLLLKLSQERFSYFGEEFLFSGSWAKVVLKQLLPRGFVLEGSLAYQQRDFGGWPAIDQTGALTGSDRRDTRWLPRALIRWEWGEGQAARGGGPQGVGISLDYTYLWQRSTNAWYDTSAHLCALSLSGSW